MRVELDQRVDVSFGRRATDWEIKGVPVRIEVGPRDLAEGNVTLVERQDGEKSAIHLAGVATAVKAALDSMQANLLREATEFRDANTADVASIEDALEAAATGFARIPWASLGEEGEARLAQKAVTVRCLQRPDGSCPDTADEPDLVAVVGRSY